MKHKFTHYGLKGFLVAQGERTNAKGIAFDATKGPYTTTDGVIHLTPPPNLPTFNEAMNYLYACLHEMWHHDPRKSDWALWLEENKIPMGSFPGVLGNIGGDINNDYHYTDELKGQRDILNVGRRDFFNTVILPQYKKHKGEEVPNVETHIKKVCTAWMNTAMDCYLPSMGSALEELLPLLSEEEQEHLRKLHEGEYYQEFMNEDSEYNRQEIWKRLLKEVFDYEYNPESPEPEGPEPEDESSEKEGSGEMDGSKEEEASDGEEMEQKEATVRWEDLIFDNHNEKEKQSTESLTIDYSSYKEGDISNYQPIEHKVITSFTEKDHYYLSKVAKVYAKVSKISSKKMRKLLKIRSEEDWEIDKRVGKLDIPRLHRAVTGQTRAHRNTIWKQTKQENILDTAVTVIVDCSGSMGGDRYANACVGMMLLNDSISPLRIPLRLVGFTQPDMIKQYIYQWKDFTQRNLTADALMHKCCSIPTMGNNLDGDAILYEYHKLLKRQEKKKVMVVLSDGQPAGWNHTGDIVLFTKDIISRIQKAKQIDIFGIGIQTRHVKEYYKHSKYIKKVEDLPGVIIDTIRSKVL